ncbi:MAG: exopolysaccharide biosynthesis polyprenyl glycosylphosphotransferase [Clostridiales bacterium]|nr:exopolysaccharide biosynthesis polyprenyl glycosylphosphotransferase [Clostridiales bacterium]
MNRRYVLSQVVKILFQCLLYVSLFLTFFLLLSVTNPQIINMSRTAATTMATFAIVLLILTYVYGGYQLGVKKARSVFSSLLISIILTDIATYLQLQIMNVNPANNDRLILFGEDFWLFMGAMLLQVGLIYLFVSLGYHFYFRINPPQRCCVITSSQEQAEHIAEKIATFRQKYRLGEVLHYACEDVRDTILEHDVVFLAGVPDTEEAELKAFCYKHGKTTYLLAELGDVITSTAEQSVIDDTLFLYIHRLEPTLIQRLVKRLSDIVISLLGIVISSPIMLIAAVAILLSRNGPVFFKQKRATIGEQVFDIIKFRTMYTSACDMREQSACVNDGRITRVGRVLRKYRIDELPQLFNVLVGDMSIVGPRPEMLENVNRYTQEVPEFEYRKQMKAGLTGMAQIDGKYNTTPKDKVILDLLYIENFSLMLDAKLILRTVTVFFRRDSTEGFHDRKRARCPQMRTAGDRRPDARDGACQAATPCAAHGKPAAIVSFAAPEIEYSVENAPVEKVLDAAELEEAAALRAGGSAACGAGAAATAVTPTLLHPAPANGAQAGR